MSLIAELYERDPLELTKEDLDEIIAYNRKARQLFKKLPAKPAKAKKPVVDAKVNL